MTEILETSLPRLTKIYSLSTNPPEMQGFWLPWIPEVFRSLWATKDQSEKLKSESAKRPVFLAASQPRGGGGLPYETDGDARRLA